MMPHTWEGFNDNFGFSSEGFLRVYKTVRHAYCGYGVTNGYSVADLVGSKYKVGEPVFSGWKRREAEIAI
jgi:hypothetical protein